MRHYEDDGAGNIRKMNVRTYTRGYVKGFNPNLMEHRLKPKTKTRVKKE